MKREIIKIDEEKCNGCGLCIPNCHEGALQIIDGKARLISDLMCDGLGACIGHCPEGAMEIEVREAEPYNEYQVMEEMVKKGKNVIIAHMKHLKDHGESVFLSEAGRYLKTNAKKLSLPVEAIIDEIDNYHPEASHEHPGPHNGGGCPGSMSMSFAGKEEKSSQLTQWPVQMHLINPNASHFKKSDLLLAADCVAYATGGFHNDHLKGKTLAIACPKLDSNKEAYLQKLIALIDQAQINTITVMKMEVPCCSGIEQIAVQAAGMATRNVPVKSVTVGIRGEIQNEAWL